LQLVDVTADIARIPVIEAILKKIRKI